MEDKKKMYMVGSDGSGGFGVPADYAGNLDGHLDDVIDEHNSRASKYHPSIYGQYEKLPKNNLVRQQATDYERMFNSAAQDMNKCFVQLDKQKKLAESLCNILNKHTQYLVEYINTNADYYDSIISDSDIRSDIRTDLVNTIISFRNSLIKPVRESEFELYDICDSLVELVTTLSNFNANEMIGSIKPLQLILEEMSAVREELAGVSHNGAGIILLSYNMSRDRYEKLMEALYHMQEKIQSAVAQKSKNVNMRLLSEMEENQDVINGTLNTNEIPDNVPHYHLALENSPRVCGNCRFFQGETGVNGHCSAYNFTAKANYLCDAWQNNFVEPAKSFKSGVPYQSDMVYMPVEPSETMGRVPASIVRIDPDENNQNWETQSTTIHANTVPDANAALRQAKGEFLPEDEAWSEALRSLVKIQAVQLMNGYKVYNVKLIDGNGAIHGYAITAGSDLKPRSQSAIKNTIKSHKIDTPDLQEAIDSTRKVYESLKVVCDSHQDVVRNPLSNQNVLTPLRDQLFSELKTAHFKGVSTGKKRKYYRAIQTAMVSIGAARQILFEGYKAINVLKRQGSPTDKIRTLMYKAQTDAYSRVKEAYKQVEDALTLPSAMHKDEAPGIKLAKSRLLEDIRKTFNKNNMPLNGDEIIENGYGSEILYTLQIEIPDGISGQEFIERVSSIASTVPDAEITRYGRIDEEDRLIYIDIKPGKHVLWY